jgi:prephenate dehydrogenase
VPANLLPYLANDLPKGNILIILPSEDQKLKQAVEKVATLLEAEGHRVTTLPPHQFT